MEPILSGVLYAAGASLILTKAPTRQECKSLSKEEGTTATRNHASTAVQTMTYGCLPSLSSWEQAGGSVASTFDRGMLPCLFRNVDPAVCTEQKPTLRCLQQDGTY